MEELQAYLSDNFQIDTDKETLLCVLHELGFKNLNEIEEEHLQGIADRVSNKLSQSVSVGSSEEPITDQFAAKVYEATELKARQHAAILMKQAAEVPEMTRGFFVSALLNQQEELRQNPHSISINIKLAHVLGTEALHRNMFLAWLMPFFLFSIVLLLVFIPKGNHESNQTETNSTYLPSSR